jgi:hypothetical protein
MSAGHGSLVEVGHRTIWNLFSVTEPMLLPMDKQIRVRVISEHEGPCLTDVQARQTAVRLAPLQVPLKLSLNTSTCKAGGFHADSTVKQVTIVDLTAVKLRGKAHSISKHGRH